MRENKITLYHWLLFTICFLGTAFAGTTSTLMSVYLPVAVKDLLGNKSADELNYISAYINAIFIFGATAGGFLSGIVSDKAGRKAGLILSIAFYGVATILTGYMPGWWGVVICRFLTGVGFGGILVTAPTIMIEVWPGKTRAIFIGIVSIAIPVGIFSSGAINFNVAAWRSGFLVGVPPIMLAFIAIWVVRESEQWKNRHSHAVQKKEKLFEPGHRADLIVGSLTFGTMLIGLWAIFSWLPTWLQTLITTTDGQKERGMSMMMLGAGGLAGGFISGWMVNVLKMRRSMMVCFAACLVLSLILFTSNISFGKIIYVEMALLSFFFGASQGVLAIYIPSLFPTDIRGRATGFCFNIGRIFTAVAVLFVGVLVATLGGYSNALFVFSLVFLIGLVVTFFSKRAPAQELV
ncbi:MAG: transporter [Flavipsychrobacter sp.]|jgi:MFS family permease|nr:transporter [Flavipsychrobacter sp.]